MAHPKAGRPKQTSPKAEVVAREAEVMKLRRGGLTWDAIGERLGITASGAHTAYQRALVRVVKEDVDAIRQLENDRLDTMQAAIWGKVLQGDNASITNALRIQERRAKLNGLDKPIQVQAEVVSYDANSVEARLAAIVASRAITASASVDPLDNDPSEAA
jgi:hypothetical protein